MSDTAIRDAHRPAENELEEYRNTGKLVNPTQTQSCVAAGTIASRGK
jgi:hypothetical protein